MPESFACRQHAQRKWFSRSRSSVSFSLGKKFALVRRGLPAHEAGGCGRSSLSAALPPFIDKEMTVIPSISRIASLTLAAMLSTSALAAGGGWDQIAQVLGKSGAELPGDVYRVGLPRSDLKVSLDGVEIKPTLALGSWLAFQKTGGQATVMGDLVLVEEEVAPVMNKLIEGGIEVTALHNHLLRPSPATLYMHIRGHGDPVKLAAALHDALAETKTPFEAAASGTAKPAAAEIDLDSAAIGQTLGAKGAANGGVLPFTFPRAEAVTEEGMAVPPSMGLAIANNFQPTGGGKAAVTGDFVLTAQEVNPVLRELLGHGIEVTAVHSHMLDEQPRLFFMHFWANDDAQKLAKGLRAALDKVAIKRG